MGIGPTELVIVLLIVVVIFGGTRFAQIGKGLGTGIKEFKKAMKNDDDTQKPS